MIKKRMFCPFYKDHCIWKETKELLTAWFSDLFIRLFVTVKQDFD